MEHFIDVYKKKPELCEKLLDLSGIKINLKVDGKPFQVVYNEQSDSLEYHGRSGDETHIGPEIDDYTRLFSKPVNDAIAHIEKRVDVFKKYKFLTFEVIDNMLLLTAIIDKNDEFITSADKIKEIADELDTDIMPTLWEGKLSAEQIDSIVNILSSGLVPEKKDFIDWVNSMFNTYKNYPEKLISAADDFIEGIVFFFDVNDKIAEYKLVDPTYRQSMKDRDNENAIEREKNADTYEKIYNAFVDYAEKAEWNSQGSWLEKLQHTFFNMMSDNKTFNKLMNLGAKIRINTSKTYSIQTNRVIPELKKEIKTKGNVYKQLLELFIKLFYKPKKRGFIISKEFQERINNIIERESK